MAMGNKPDTFAGPYRAEKFRGSRSCGDFLASEVLKNLPNETETITRWTIARAAIEFGLDRKTLAKYLARDSTFPGEDGMYSTCEIVAAIRGDLTAERTLLTKAQRRREEIKLAMEMEDVIPQQRVYELLENIFLAIKSKITGSHLSEAEQDAILTDLAGLRDADL